MHWMLIGYMFLFIHRPFEVWPWLGDLRIERVYMLATLTVWFLYPGKRWLSNLQHFAYAAFATAVLTAWVISPWMETSQPLIEDYFKILVFYVLLVTTVRDERGLQIIITAFLAIMAIYLTHSLREYLNGRHTFRMGITRMIGVDTTMGDPNSFGASIVFALPFTVAFWRAGIGGRLGRLALTGYVGLSGLCILLTGSRSSLLGLLLWGGLMILQDRRRWKLLTLAVIAAPIVFLALPESLQTRFETIINSDVGPESARESGEGRIEGLFTGLELWAGNPLTGVGPGAWRPATGSHIESHNLYGQLLGELGTLGGLGFALILYAYWRNTRRMRTIRREVPEWSNDFVFQAGSAIGMGVFLLLVMGNFGHNLFRFNWLWYGGFLLIARHCVERRWEEWNEGGYDDDEDTAAEELPAVYAWRVHGDNFSRDSQPALQNEQEP